MSLARARVAPPTIANVSGADTSAELVALWLARHSRNTRRAYELDLAWWATELGRALDIRALTVRDVVSVLEREHSCSPATLARRTATLRSLLGFAHRTGFCPWNVGSVIRTRALPNELAQRILDPDQIAALVAAARSTLHPERDRMIVRLLYVSGVRVAELVALEWRHVRRKGDRAVLTVHGKGGKTRAIGLPPAVAAELATFREARGKRPRGLVFRSRRGLRMDTRDVQRLLKRLATLAELEPGPTPHWLRHSHATHASERGCPMHVVQATLGHSSVATTTRYLHARPSESSADYVSGG